MNGGTKFLTGAAILLLAACGPDGKLEIRPIGQASRATSAAAGPVAEAYAQLGLGNVGLALEQFRTAARNYPDDPQAFAGMARCYDMMSRYDLSRRNYETALALAPNDPNVLETFAASLDAQGLREEAASVRAELTLAAIKSVTVALPPPENVATPVGNSVTVALPPPRPSSEATRASGPRLERMSLGEVALMTSGTVPWRSASRTANAGFVPLKAQSSAMAGVRLLNAARIEGLAARTRSLLRTRGWTRVAIGNSAKQRATSLILYPDAQRPLAERMSAQFGLPTMVSASAAQVTILLGRDAPAKLGRG